MADPLPHLGARDLGGRGVLHQAVDGGGAVAAQPGGDVLDPHVHVQAQAGLGDLARGGARGRAARAAPTSTSSRARSIWFGRVPSTASNSPIAASTESGWATQLPSKPAADSRALSDPTASLGPLRGLRVGAAGNHCRHAAHRVGPATVAGPDQQVGVGLHERHGHRDLRAVRQHALGPLPQALDRAEDVVPAARVEPRAVVTQLVQDLVHLERGRQGLDQHGGPDRSAVEPQCLLRDHEGVVPQPRLQVRLQLGQVEEGARAALQQRLGVVVHVQREVEQAARHGLAVDGRVALDEVPASRAHQQRGALVLEPVLRGRRARRRPACRAPPPSGWPARRPCWPRSASWRPRSPP